MCWRVSPDQDQCLVCSKELLCTAHSIAARRGPKKMAKIADCQGGRTTGYTAARAILHRFRLLTALPLNCDISGNCFSWIPLRYARRTRSAFQERQSNWIHVVQLSSATSWCSQLACFPRRWVEEIARAG